MKNLETIRRMELEDWNRNAGFYRDDAQSPLMQHLAARRDALYAIAPGERVLDLGCGTGATVARLRLRGVDAVGVDFAPEMIHAAHEQFGLTDVVRCADAAELPFDDEVIDVVIADGVLHHLAVQGKLLATLREVRRVLKPGGRLCVFDRNGSVMSAALLHSAIGAKRLIGWVTGKGQYASSATRNEIPFGGPCDQRLLKRHGFRPLRAQPVASAPFFMSVVLFNAVQYFLSRALREGLERRLAPWLSRIDDGCAYGRLCVEQISVWERVPTRTASPVPLTRTVSAPRERAQSTRPGIPAGRPELDVVFEGNAKSGVPSGRTECSPALQCGVAPASHTVSPVGTDEISSHHLDSEKHKLESVTGGAT